MAKLCATFPGEYWREKDRERAYPAEVVRALQEAPWWDEMVTDIVETPDFAEPDEPPEQILTYARDVVKERVDAHFAQQAEELAENLRRKEALCEQAEALADSTSWVKTADELRRLQAEWKEIGPVPRAQSRKVWDRFRKPCDDFFTRWQQHRHLRSQEWARNLALKEALCEKAESLQDSTDWEATAARLKQLQAEWRQIGAVKKSRSEAIWRRFRGACDHFFDRYKHRDALALQAVQAGASEYVLKPFSIGCPVPVRLTWATRA